MAVSSRPDEAAPDDEPPIRAYHTTPDRTVFTESGNRDGWISTDLTVALSR